MLLVVLVAGAVGETLDAHACLVGEKVGLEVGLEGSGQGQVLDAVDGGLRGDGTTAKLLE